MFVFEIQTKDKALTKNSRILDLKTMLALRCDSELVKLKKVVDDFSGKTTS